MYLRIKENDLSDPILKEIGYLFNHAEIFSDQAEYIPENNELSLSINRFPVVKKTILSKTKHSKEAINCEVVIRNVEKCNIEKNCKDIEMFTILFGLQFEKNRIYFSSAEEDHGEPCYSVDCMVSEFDIEINDI